MNLEKSQEDIVISPSGNNLRILYITVGIIIGVLILWIIIIVLTQEHPLKILTDMTNYSLQLNMVSDSSLSPLSLPQLL